MTFTVSSAETGMRLDKWLCQHLPDHSRTLIQRLIKEGHVHANAVVLYAPNRAVLAGESIVCTLAPKEPMHLIANPAVRFEVIYEDDEVLVINKPAGLTVHPGAGTQGDTLVHGLLAHVAHLSEGHGGDRPGIVHRLDRDTTGALLVAKTDRAHHALSTALRARQITRTYTALVYGALQPPSDTIHTYIDRHPVRRTLMRVSPTPGRVAITHYQTDWEKSGVSQVTCRLETGRTHQIRVHLSYKSCPIVGDPLYCNHVQRLGRVPAALVPLFQVFTRQALHARSLVFPHPTTQELITCEAPLPKDMEALLEGIHAL